MVVINRTRHIAIAVRRDRHGVVIVPMSSGSLSAVHLTDKEFASAWTEYNYSLEKALDRFLAHVSAKGATKEAQESLQKLKNDPVALAPRIV